MNLYQLNLIYFQVLNFTSIKTNIYLLKNFFTLFVYLKKIFTNILTPKPQLFFIGNYLVYKNLLKKVNKKKFIE